VHSSLARYGAVMTVLELMDQRIAELDQLVRNARRDGGRRAHGAGAATLEILLWKLTELRCQKHPLNTAIQPSQTCGTRKFEREARALARAFAPKAIRSRPGLRPRAGRSPYSPTSDAAFKCVSRDRPSLGRWKRSAVI
jgi:hypothetical protein